VYVNILILSPRTAPENNESSRSRRRETLQSKQSENEEGPPTKKQHHDTIGPTGENLGYGDDNICLTAEQQVVVDTALGGSNIFFTGAAGCGKTITLKKLLASFKKRKIKYQVVAPTGIAALPLDGKTTYSFLGWKPDTPNNPIAKLVGFPSHKVKSTVKEVEVLIIEEISMVSSLMLERMNLVMQSIMENQRPFGGKQVMFTGDFHQLPVGKPAR
jgi:ATP-dependent DNA helicase PIF1